ncbi:alpha/beta fold hydrolase [Ancylobacter lacus]|uniref:alpha/beta fold hydrolase n=1 Tax=Ancylobacter lacus TaxID=2579970 RepID=UPI001BCFC9D0|nr:alpha/beta hydrolase [Ancylobacter lacus]MBS7541343.1 alpha/beta hydrolase [Ancylobacter lacus]
MSRCAWKGWFMMGALALLGGAGLPPPSAQAAGCTSIAAGKCHLALPTGIDLAYIERGPAEGTAVIFVHGLTDSIRSWEPTIDALARAAPDLHILAVDLRGHGASGMPDAALCAPAPEACFRPAQMAQDIAALMDARGIARAYVVGHSLGSFVTQELALAAPQKVAGAVLVATAATGVGNVALRDYVLAEPVEGSWKKALEAQGKAFPVDFYRATPEQADPKVAAWLAANWDVDPLAPAAFLEPYILETAKVPLGTWIGATRAALAFDNAARLAELRVPVLVLWGSQDNIFLPADQEAVKAALTRAAAAAGITDYWKQYGRVPLPQSGAQESDIGHNVQWGAPEAVAGDVLAFIRTGRPDPQQPYAVKKGEGFVIEAGAPDPAIVELR